MAYDTTENERLAAGLRVFGKTARYLELEGAWARYWGIHYDLDDLQAGGPLLPWEQDTEADGSLVPVAKRKPAHRHNTTMARVNRAHDMLAGEGQFPALSVVGADGSPNAGATEALARIVERLDWTGLWDEACLTLLATGTVVVGIDAAAEDRTRLFGTAYLPFHCTPVFGRDRRAQAVSLGIADDELLELWVRSLVADEPSVGGRVRWWLHRRLHGPFETVEYEPVDVTDWSRQNDEDPPLTVARRIPHGLGFVPAVWVRARRVTGEIDGVPVTHGAESLADAIDRMESQRYRANVYHGDPGLAPDDSVAASALQQLSGDEQVAVGARRVLPVPMHLVEATGSGQASQAEMTRDLRRAVDDVTGIYLHDPDRIKGTLAASALEQLFAPTVARVASLRRQLGAGMCALARHALRLAEWSGAERTGLGRSGWKVTAAWPPVIRPNVEDAQAMATVAQALDGLVTRETRTRYIAPALGVVDPVAEAKAARAEADADASRFSPMERFAQGAEQPIDDQDDDQEPQA